MFKNTFKNIIQISRFSISKNGKDIFYPKYGTSFYEYKNKEVQKELKNVNKKILRRVIPNYPQYTVYNNQYKVPNKENRIITNSTDYDNIDQYNDNEYDDEYDPSKMK